MGLIICLIGSTKFENTFKRLEKELSLKGYIVLSPLVYNQSGDIPPCGESEKQVLDMVQLEKVKMSDFVFVVDEKGYIGNSTKKQEDFAKLLKKPILYYSKGDEQTL